MFISKQAESNTDTNLQDRPLQSCWDYAPAAIEYVHEKTDLNKGMILADINSGRGKLAKHFLKLANTVYCVERDRQMRQLAAERFWKSRNFIDINGTADKTNIGNNTVDVIVCGNGMGGCEIPRAVTEFKRILKQDGWLILMENTASIDQLNLRTHSGAEIENPFATELMPFYYPSGSWERKEYQFQILLNKEDLPEFLSSFSQPYARKRTEEILNQLPGELLDITGKTVLHIGQPGY